VVKKGAQLVAVSMDGAEEMKKFKESLKADYAMIPDSAGQIVDAYGVRNPEKPMAMRTTFVIGQDRKVLQVQSGPDAIDPAGAITACPLPAKRTPAPGRKAHR